MIVIICILIIFTDSTPAATCGVNSVEVEGSLGSVDNVPKPEDPCMAEGCVNDGCTSSVVNFMTLDHRSSQLGHLANMGCSSRHYILCVKVLSWV